MKDRWEPVQVRRFNEAGRGYRLLASRTYPEKPPERRAVDSWVPVLAPSQGLWADYLMGHVGWKDFSERYQRELRSAESQDLIKPFALLSFRKPVVVLCACGSRLHCPEKILAQALEECRQRGVFVLLPRA